MLSAVTSKTYTTIDKGQYVEFNCFARDQDASVPGTFKWVYEKDSQLGEWFKPSDFSIIGFKNDNLEIFSFE